MVEMLMAVSAAGIVAMCIAAYLSGSSLLFAKNVSTNLTNNSLRSAIDKITQGVTEGCSSVTLIDTSGNTVSSGAAAGVRFDEYLGGPYVVTNSSGTGLAATAMSVVITRYVSNDAPIPAQNDVLLLDGSPTVRLVVSSVVAGSIDSSTNRQSLTLTLASAPGTAIPWQASRIKQAHLVRRQAYVVIPSGSRNELRFFSPAETIGNYITAASDPTKNKLVIKNVGIDAGDSTPFAISSVDGTNFLQLTLRVRSDQYGTRLAGKEANKFSSIQRIQSLVNPRGQEQ